MALLKAKALETGFTASYWRVVGLSFEVGGPAIVHWALYKDAAARQAGSAPTFTETVDYISASSPFTVAALEENSPIALAYVARKQEAAFTGAEDA